MLNRVILIGRLTDAPALRYTQAGDAVARFTLAVDRPRKQDGSHDTDFIDCVAWRKLAETLAQHLDKGQELAVEGRIQVRNYTAQDGSKRKAVEVVAERTPYWGRKKDGQAGGQQASATGPASDDLADISPVDEDVPF